MLGKLWNWKKILVWNAPRWFAWHIIPASCVESVDGITQGHIFSFSSIAYETECLCYKTIIINAGKVRKWNRRSFAILLNILKALKIN